MTGPGTLDTLTTQLADFVDLADSKDLPGIHEVVLRRKSTDPAWRAVAQLKRVHGVSPWSTLRDWQVATGGTVHIGKSSKTSFGEKPWRRVDVVVSYVGVEVRIWDHVDADDEIPAWAQAPEAAEAASA